MYMILERAIDFSILKEEDKVKYWLFRVGVHKGTPTCIWDDPIDWMWFDSEWEARERFKDWEYKIEKWCFDIFKIFESIRNHWNWLLN